MTEDRQQEFMPRGAVAIVGTGNFAINLAAVCETFGLEIPFFVDEFRAEMFQGKPVLRAEKLDDMHQRQVDKWLLAISHQEHREAAVWRMESRGIPRDRILPLSDDPDLQIMRLMFEEFGTSAVSAFLMPGLTDVQALEDRFLAPGWDATLRSLDLDRRTIGLGYYGRGGGFRRHISGLIPLLEERFNVVTMADESMGGAEESIHHLSMSARRACTWEGLDLVLSAHVFPCAPPAVPRVSFSHVIYDFNLMAESHASRIAHSDTHYLFASSRPCFEWYADLVPRFGLKNKICVIPGGYLQLDRNLVELQQYTGSSEAILYAPTLSLADYPYSELVTSIAQGPDILETLLATFPDRDIIYRPHPSDLRLFQMDRQGPRLEPFKRMLDICRGDNRCRLDDNPTSYLPSYRQTALLVSDSSSTAFTFALSTGRPVVFFSPREDEMVAALGDTLKFVADRTRVGRVVRNCEELEAAVRHLTRVDMGDDLAAFRDDMVFHPGGAARYFADHVDFMLDGERHPDWLYLNW